ncbi:Alpha/Beta hydrolase protein [Xylogone sp. PMI_703]|nr:Alpha/Beta hydrolase protein [Xylogone sp. PMI_703]
MDQVRDLHALGDDSIQAVIPVTYKIFTPLLLAHKAEIKAITRKTEPYGPHPRQKLDIYKPPNFTLPGPAPGPILIFLYGGGLVRGDKIQPTVPEGLVYANVGAWFATRGITTIIPDYRRVNSSFGGEDAAYPSGGEDISLVMSWIERWLSTAGPADGKGKRDVFLMGNSAGGLHVTTFLLEERWKEQRLKYLDPREGLVLRGAIGLAPAFYFSLKKSARMDMLSRYYGSDKDIEDHAPYGLLTALGKSKTSRAQAGVPPMLVLLGEWDPIEEIGKTCEDFVELWTKVWGEGMDFQIMAGQNHISPPLALMSGDEEGEKWAKNLVKWIEGHVSPRNKE